MSDERLPLGVALGAATLALLLVATAAAQTPPTPAGTPWPVPPGLNLTGSSILLDDQNYPLPPDRQKHFFGLTWEVPASYTGVYEVQRAARTLPLKPPAEDLYAWETVAGSPFPATAAVDGKIAFQEQVPSPLSRVYCYRLRTFINGETGPYSEPLCTTPPPTTGAAPATVTPLPPVVGNTPGGSAGLAMSPLAIAAITILAATGGTHAVYIRRRRKDRAQVLPR